MRGRSVLPVLVASAFAGACASSAPEPSPQAAPPTVVSAPTVEIGPPPDDRPVLPSASISKCEAYLTLYRTCEPRLQSDIQAGKRRTYKAERGWIEFMRTQPEGAQLEEACAAMHQEIAAACG